jgi:hypothetical protein
MNAAYSFAGGKSVGLSVRWTGTDCEIDVTSLLTTFPEAAAMGPGEWVRPRAFCTRKRVYPIEKMAALACGSDKVSFNLW